MTPTRDFDLVLFGATGRCGGPGLGGHDQAAGDGCPGERGGKRGGEPLPPGVTVSDHEHPFRCLGVGPGTAVGRALTAGVVGMTRV